MAGVYLDCLYCNENPASVPAPYLETKTLRVINTAIAKRRGAHLYVS